MNRFTEWLQKHGILLSDPVPATATEEVVEPVAVPEPVFDLDAIMKRVRECKRQDYVLLCGKLFQYVEDRTTHFSPFGGDGRRIPVLTYMPDNFHIHMDYMPVESEFYPKHPRDIEMPGDWITHIDECESLAGRVSDLIDQMNLSFKVIAKDDPLLFVKSGGYLIPCIKLYTDLSWVDAGWPGPAIVVGYQSDRRYPTATGLIPDTTELYDMKGVVTELEAFRDGPLKEMFTNHYAAIKFNDSFEAFIKYLDDKSITYR